MFIPKIIWGIWCDFNKNEDGVLNETLNFFIDRIKQLHPTWQINIITKWNVLLDYVKNENTINELLNNSNISAAHKSDMIRFFLLKNFGGVWLDVSTFLIISLDSLIEQPNTDFICYYANEFDVREWFLKPLSEMYEDVAYSERIKTWVDYEENIISLKNKDINFIPENYFICCSKNHKISTIIYNLLENFWANNLKLIVNKNTLCFYLNKYMIELMEQVFNTNIWEFDLIKKFNVKSFDDRNFRLLSNVLECSYFFNYLQMYIAIENYCMENKPYNTIYNIINEHLPNTQAFKDLCIRNACQNIIISFENNKPNILLLSASYNRAGKWSDKLEERLSWDNTYLGTKLASISNNKQAQQLLRELSQEGFMQFKFSSYTRNSKIIPVLMKWYGNQIGGKRKKKSKKHKKRVTKKRRKTLRHRSF